MVFKENIMKFSKIDKLIWKPKLTEVHCAFENTNEMFIELLNKFAQIIYAFQKFDDLVKSTLNLNLSNTGSGDEKLWQDSMHWCEFKVLNTSSFI